VSFVEFDENEMAR